MSDSLEQVAAEVRTCHRCPLGGTRTRAVPGEGPADAAVLLIGEGPGFHEDQQGRPFVGASGKLLESLLEKSGLSRGQVFITNVVKCRPPENRDPQPKELVACRDYLDRQIALLQPKIVITLGRFSMERYFPGQSITRIHGQGKRVGEVHYVPMFHPAAALRNDSWRQALQADFEKVRALLDELQPRRKPIAEDDEPGQLSLF